MRQIPINAFLIDTANRIDFFLDRTHALLHDIERDAEKNDYSEMATHCGIISCDLDDLDDLKNRIWEYENGLPKEAALICSNLYKTEAAD